MREGHTEKRGRKIGESGSRKGGGQRQTETKKGGHRWDGRDRERERERERRWGKREDKEIDKVREILTEGHKKRFSVREKSSENVQPISSSIHLTLFYCTTMHFNSSRSTNGGKTGTSKYSFPCTNSRSSQDRASRPRTEEQPPNTEHSTSCVLKKLFIFCARTHTHTHKILMGHN